MDVFAMRFWTAGIGQVRIAYEIKVSRADFLAETRNPAKRALAKELTHQFYFAVPKGLVAVQEVPKDCGLIELVGNKLRVKVKAPVGEPRFFNEGEVLQLLRMELFRSGADRAKRETEGWKYTAEERGRHLEGVRGELKLAEQRLLRWAGKNPRVGSLWRGPWERAVWRRPKEPDIQVVEVVESARDGWVRFRRTDGADGPVYMVEASLARGEFLRKFDPVIA